MLRCAIDARGCVWHNRAMDARIILCLDLDAFFASVEELLHPEWRGLPLVVGGKPEERGVVASCSYAARAFGVRSAMPMGRALKLCPQAIRVPPHFHAYGDYSRRVMAIIHSYGLPVEQVSVDEVFLDATDGVRGWGGALAFATDLKQRIRADTGLACTVGIAANKLVAKIASNQGKPDGLLQVPAGTEAQFLAPLPIGKLWGVGPKSQARLEALGIRTIADLQNAPLARLQPAFGAWAYDLQRKAHGSGSHTVESSRPTKSVSRETTFVKDVGDIAQLDTVVLGLSEEVAHDLRAEGLQARTVAIKLRWANFETHTRQTTLPRPTRASSGIYQAAIALLRGAWKRGAKARLIGVRATNLSAEQQLSFFEPPDTKQEQVDAVVDDLRAKFGDRVIRRARLL